MAGRSCVLVQAETPAGLHKARSAGGNPSLGTTAGISGSLPISVVLSVGGRRR